MAVVTNQTGRIGTTHLVDSLLALKVNVVKVLAPEHGFRGDADAGEHVKDGRDARTGLPLISLYGDNKKPKPEQLNDVDVLVFDIQDVGVRFYTYISTLHYVMEAAAEQHKQLVVLDRPNPNGFYVDGPVLEPANSSFVGMHPVPLVHGMTMGEYAGMINGEGWLSNKVRCDLQVITCLAYDHAMFYELPVRPSPNLPNMAAVYLYPSLGLFEGTPVSVGRGTTKPFQIIGFPGCTVGVADFTPQSLPGAKNRPTSISPAMASTSATTAPSSPAWSRAWPCIGSSVCIRPIPRTRAPSSSLSSTSWRAPTPCMNRSRRAWMKSIFAPAGSLGLMPSARSVRSTCCTTTFIKHEAPFH